MKSKLRQKKRHLPPRMTRLKRMAMLKRKLEMLRQKNKTVKLKQKPKVKPKNKQKLKRRLQKRKQKPRLRQRLRLRVKLSKQRKKRPRLRRPKKRHSPLKRKPHKKRLEMKNRVRKRQLQRRKSKPKLRSLLPKSQQPMLEKVRLMSDLFEYSGCFLVTYTVTGLTNLKSLSLSNLSIIRLTDVLLFATVCTFSLVTKHLFRSKLHFRTQFGLYRPGQRPGCRFQDRTHKQAI